MNIIDILNFIHEHKYFVAIYTNKNDVAMFSLGYIESLDEINVCIASYTPEGKPDGHMIIRIDTIYHVEMDTKYCKKIEYLVHKQIDDNTSISMSNNNEQSKDLLKGTLQLLNENQEIVTIWFSEDFSATGFVTSVTDENFVMTVITPYGEFDGHSIDKIENIQTIAYHRIEEKIVKYLWNNPIPNLNLSSIEHINRIKKSQ